MALSADFLAHARELIDRRGRPQKINLRRSISASYYAVFHLLVETAIEQAVPSKPPSLRPQAARSVQHAEMHTLCQDLLKATLPDRIATAFPNRISPELRDICDSFVKLQDIRHRADYDGTLQLAQSDAQRFLASAESAFKNLTKIRASEEGVAFLAALIFAKRWGR